MECYFTAAAEKDLQDIGDYIAAGSPSRALAFVTALRRQCARLCDFPLAYPLRPALAENLRVMVFRRYLVCYTAHPDRVVIERMGSRDIQALFQARTRDDE
jgi:toxin ParE1/3/4